MVNLIIVVVKGREVLVWLVLNLVWIVGSIIIIIYKFVLLMVFRRMEMVRWN